MTLLMLSNFHFALHRRQLKGIESTTQNTYTNTNRGERAREQQREKDLNTRLGYVNCFERICRFVPLRTAVIQMA